MEAGYNRLWMEDNWFCNIFISLNTVPERLKHTLFARASIDFHAHVKKKCGYSLEYLILLRIKAGGKVLIWTAGVILWLSAVNFYNEKKWQLRGKWAYKRRIQH